VPVLDTSFSNQSVDRSLVFVSTGHPCFPGLLIPFTPKHAFLLNGFLVIPLLTHGERRFIKCNAESPELLYLVKFGSVSFGRPHYPLRASPSDCAPTDIGDLHFKVWYSKKFNLEEMRIPVGQLNATEMKKMAQDTLFRKPIGMAFFNIQVLLKSSEIPGFRTNQQSGFTEKF
jgi:hypothetical protein